MSNRALRGGVFYTLLVAVAMAVALFSTQAKAEESGVFVGGQIMYGDLRYSENFTESVTGGNAVMGYYSSNNTAPGYGVLAGYKHFFNPFFGFRAYGNFYYNTFSFQGRSANYGAQGNLEGGKESLYQFNLTANADALFNVIAGENFNLGVFGGVGIGFQYWKSNRLDKVYQLHNTFIKQNQPFERQEDRRFGVALNWNAGVRMNFLKVNSLEIGAVIPMFETTIMDYKGYWYGTAMVPQGIEHKVGARQSYNAYVRYTFGF
ncbi:outer membrane beta-barrel protein [Helicobacter sp. 23-1046]